MGVSMPSGNGKVIIRASTGGGGGGSGTIPFNSGIDDASVSLLLHGNGSNGSTTFTDSSFLPSTVVGHGGIALSTAQSKFGGSSILFNRSSSQYLTIIDPDKFTLGTDDFTIETWVYLNSIPSSNTYPGAYYICGWGEDNSALGADYLIGNSQIRFAAYDGVTWTIDYSHSLNINTWYHLALVRSSGTVTLYLDGNSVATGTYSGVVYPPSGTTNAKAIAIGAGEPFSSTSGNFDGYMDDLRICKGVAKYTGNFTPPGAQLPDAVDLTLLPSSPVAGQLAASSDVLYVCVDASGPTWKKVLLG